MKGKGGAAGTLQSENCRADFTVSLSSPGRRGLDIPADGTPFRRSRRVTVGFDVFKVFILKRKRKQIS